VDFSILEQKCKEQERMNALLQGSSHKFRDGTLPMPLILRHTLYNDKMKPMPHPLPQLCLGEKHVLSDNWVVLTGNIREEKQEKTRERKG